MKVKLNHTAIGQMIAGHDLCSEQYGVSPARLTIVCGVGDAALESVCQRQGMIVSKLLQRPYPPSIMQIIRVKHQYRDLRTPDVHP